MTRIQSVEGIDKEAADKLKEVGISTPDLLLEKGATGRGRWRIARRTGIALNRIRRWRARIDLTRVNGVGEQYADLLLAAGVESVKDLARRNPARLHKKLEAVNRARPVVRRLPARGQVRGWVKQARTLRRQSTAGGAPPGDHSLTGEVGRGDEP